MDMASELLSSKLHIEYNIHMTLPIVSCRSTKIGIISGQLIYISASLILHFVSLNGPQLNLRAVL
jgi:hypothetical protein